MCIRDRGNELDGEKVLRKKSDRHKYYSESRDRINETTSRRKYSYKFHLNVNKTKVRVCQKTLLATLRLGEWMLHKWFEEDKLEEHDEILEELAVENNVNVTDVSTVL